MSTPNDTRSPITDALETLGMIHFKKEKRDVLDTLEALDVTIDIKVTVYRP